MKETGWYAKLPLAAYILMLAVCICLNIFSDQGPNIANIAVNAAMFIIVAVIFISCEARSFAPARRMVADLINAAAKIKRDALHTNRFLWEKYAESNEELFSEGVLKEMMDDYGFELRRIEQSGTACYKCSIDDYINDDLFDSVIHRNSMNQVPGAMTGLGILGTFIGLVIGLNGFNTGSTSEIAGSITPLMEGIKVAFHTSIYGMVFSLVFNYSLKRRIEDGERAVEAFISAFKKYVMPDSEKDGINRLVELAQEQTRFLESLPDQGARNLAQNIEVMLRPQFDRFDKTIADFASMQSKNQMDALSVIVNSFIAEMNRSLDGMFSNLTDSVFKLTGAQRENEKNLRQMLVSSEGALEKLQEVQRESAALTRTLSDYVVKLTALQENVQKNLELLKEMSATDRELLSGVRRQVSDIKTGGEWTAATMKQLEARIQGQEQILKSLNDTIAYSYDTIESGFDKASASVNQLAQTLDKMKAETSEKKKKGLFK